MRLAAAAIEAGHRTADEHDCFVMNCGALGQEVEYQRRVLGELYSRIDDFEEAIQRALAVLNDPEVLEPAFGTVKEILRATLDPAPE